MYHLAWIDHDGNYGEECAGLLELVSRLLELARKEANNNYGTCVISVTEGKEVDYEYIVDEENETEKIFINGHVVITNKLPSLNERLDVNCPVCGCDAGFLDDIGAKIDGEYVSLIHYGCSECGREFYV